MTTETLMTFADQRTEEMEQAWCRWIVSLPAPVMRYVLRHELELHDGFMAGQLDFQLIREGADKYVSTLT